MTYTFTLPYPPSANRSIPPLPGIYLIQNTTNGHFYVGSSVNLYQRWEQHKWYLKAGKHHNPHLQSAWNKYGAAAFEFSVLEYVDDLNDLLTVEQQWIDAYQAAKRRDSYNVCEIAGSQLGRKRSEETKQRLSIANTGKKATPEAKRKMRAAKVGKKQSPEHVAKVIASRVGKTITRRKGNPSLGHRKFTPTQVLEMRHLKKEGWSYAQLEEKFSISHGGLQKIIAGITYTDVKEVR